MKKYLVILIILTFFSCNFSNKLSSDEDLSSKINLKFRDEKKPIDLMEITDFEWDNYIVIGFFQIPKQVGKTYNIDLSNISDYATSNDSAYLLVFIKNKKAIKICQINGRVEINENKQFHFY